MLWWEELTGLLQSQPALLKREVSLRQGLIATTLEQLTSDDVLTFSHMEKILLEVQATLNEGLQQCTEGKACTVKMVSVSSKGIHCKALSGQKTIDKGALVPHLVERVPFIKAESLL